MFQLTTPGLNFLSTTSLQPDSDRREFCLRCFWVTLRRGGATKGGSGKKSSPRSLSVFLSRTRFEEGFVASRVFKKNLSEAQTTRFPRRAWSPGRGRGDHSKGAGAQLLHAASAAPIYNFYISRDSFGISEGGNGGWNRRRYLAKLQN